MAKKQTIHINGSDIVVLKQNTDDYISLTDMAKYKNAEGSVEKYWGQKIEFSKDFVPLQHEYA